MPRERGNHYKPMTIKRAIMNYLKKCDSGIDEPTLRGYLKEEFGISELKNIKKHLKDLESLRLIKKIEKPGLANCWIVDDWRFCLIKHIGSESACSIIRSAYENGVGAVDMIRTAVLELEKDGWGLH